MSEVNRPKVPRLPIIKKPKASMPTLPGRKTAFVGEKTSAEIPEFKDATNTQIAQMDVSEINGIDEMSSNLIPPNQNSVSRVPSIRKPRVSPQNTEISLTAKSDDDNPRFTPSNQQLAAAQPKIQTQNFHENKTRIQSQTPFAHTPSNAQMPQTRSSAANAPSLNNIQSNQNINSDAIRSILDAEAPLPDKSSNDLPQEWLIGNNANFIHNETSFSAPNVIPESVVPNFNPKNNAAAGNVDLEIHENLPNELAEIIAEYDDEIRHAKTRDGIRECTIQLTLARILEYTGYEKLAYVRYLKALEANHFSRTAIHELRRIARAYNKTTDVITLLQSEIDTDISAEDQAILLEECALMTYFSDERRRSEAINMLYRAMALAPKFITPVTTLTYLLLFEQRYRECTNTLETMISLTDDIDTQKACYCIKGDIESSQNPGMSDGLDSYLRALELSPGMLYAFQHAMSIFLRQRNWQTLYARAIAFAQDSKDKVISNAAMILAGGIAIDLLADFVGSNTAYEQALAFNPKDTVPLELQAENFTDDPSRWKELDDVLVRLIDISDSPREKLELTLLRAINQERNGKNIPAALNILQNIVFRKPCERLVLEYYQELLRCENRTAEVMQFSREFASRADAEDASARFASLGCYCYDILNNYVEAEQHFRDALSRNPAQKTAFEYLDAILRARNDYEGVAQIYRARLDVTHDAKQRASLLYSLATICDYSLNQPENAIVYYRLYREIYPDDVHAIHSIQRLTQRTGDWKSVIEMMLAERDSMTAASERSAVLVRVANICRYKLNKLHYARSFLMQAKDEDPTSITVLNELEDILTESRNWKELIAILQEHLSLQTKPADRVVTLNTMAHIYKDLLCDHTAAVTCYEQILKLEPENLVAITNLSTIYRQTRNFAAYYELALARVKSMTHPGMRAKHLFKVALKTLTLFNEPEQAISLLEMSQQNDPTYTPTIFLLTLLYGAYARINNLVAVLQDFTNLTKNQVTKSAASLTLAYLHTWLLKSPDDAIHPLELSLALTPDAMNARFMLIFDQYKLGQMNEIASLFTEGAQNTKDKILAVHNYNLAAFIAHLNQDIPGAFENEITALKAAVEIDNNNVVANERLESMEPSRANLVPFIEKRLQRATAEDKTELQLALVEAMYAESPQRAFSEICNLIEENPTHLPALRVAANMAEKLGNPKLLCQFLSMQAQQIEHLQTRLTTWIKAARIARDVLAQTDLAVEYFKQAFMLAPTQMDICDELVELLKKKHDIAAIDTLMQLHTRSISKEDQVNRYLQMAETYLKDFNEPMQAAVKYRQILELQHDNTAVMWKLADIEISQQHWNDARSVLEMILETESGPSEIAFKTRIALASLLIEHLDAPRQAIPILQDILTNSPENIQALEQMASIYFSDGKFNEALALLLRLNTLIPPPQNIRILLQMANIYQAISEKEKLTRLMSDAAALVKLQPSILYEIQPFVSKCKDPAVLRAFIENLLAIKNLPVEIMLDIYEFCAFCYAGPLHMRFEADKYAVAAANLAPNSLRTQLLASKVFDPKEAMVHASAAAAISPLSIEPYQAMLQIAVNANRPDLQCRVEQQLFILNAPIVPTESLQENFVKRYPDKPNQIDDAFLLNASPYEINPNVRDLLLLAAAKTKIFETPEYPSSPISNEPAINRIFQKLASTFGVQCTARIAEDLPFFFLQSPEFPEEILFDPTPLNKCSEAEVRFHMAAALTHYKLGTLPICQLPPENINMLLSGLLGLYDEKLTTPAILNSIKSYIPRNLRKSVTELIAQRGIHAFKYDPKQLIHAANSLAVNIGHIFSANLTASVSALIRAKAPSITLSQMPSKWQSHYTNTPYLANLLSFNTSERFSELRQKLGIFLKMSST